MALFTTVTEDYGRVSMHGVRRELVRAQADAAGVPLVEVGIPAACTNAVYEARMAQALSAPPLDGVGEMAFADLFLEEIRAYRVERLRAAGRNELGEMAIRDGFAFQDLIRPASPPRADSEMPGSSDQVRGAAVTLRS